MVRNKMKKSENVENTESAEKVADTRKTVWLRTIVNREMFKGGGDIALSVNKTTLKWYEDNGYSWGQVATKITQCDVIFGTKNNKVNARLVLDGRTIGFINNFSPVDGLKAIDPNQTKKFSADIYECIKSLTALNQFNNTEPMTADEIATDVAATATMV